MRRSRHSHKLFPAASLGCLLICSCSGPSAESIPPTSPQSVQQQVPPPTPVLATAPAVPSSPTGAVLKGLRDELAEIVALEKQPVFSTDPKTGRPNPPPDHEGLRKKRIVIERQIRDISVLNSHFTASLSNVVVDWSQGVQQFQLTLFNGSDLPASGFVIVLAENGSLIPPRREMWPSSSIFTVLDSTSGDIEPMDIQKAWITLPKANLLEIACPPRKSSTIEGSHPLAATSRLSKWEGQAIPRSGFVHYGVWAFTSDGKCFHSATFNID